MLRQHDALLDKFKTQYGMIDSYSQLKQDLFVKFCLEKENGYFVEFGACDGVLMSNTFLLEKYYAWTGILAEPILKYFDVLRGTRSCNIENSCVYSESGLKVSFSQVEGFELISGIEETMIRGYWEGVRESNKVTKEYPTISLDDLLDKYNAPNIIDYLSMDTEGSEFDILNSYSFSRKINVITVEHEGFDTKTCIKITNLLEKNGYIRIFEEQSLHDAWFVNQATYDNMLRRYGLW